MNIRHLNPQFKAWFDRSLPNELVVHTVIELPKVEKLQCVLYLNWKSRKLQYIL